VDVKAVWWVRREPSTGVIVSIYMKCGVEEKRTNLLELGHSLVVLPIKLRPFREVVLGRRRPQLALQLHNLLLELLSLLR
jgi:hypothetical protein